MAFFKFRKGGDDAAIAKPSQPESVDAMRRRARQRLIGAAVLVLAGIVGFPLLFDTQPRPIALDIPIDIPDRNKAKPLSLPSAPAAPVKSAAPPATAQVTTSAAAAPSGAAPVAKVEPATPSAATPAPNKPEAPKPAAAKPELAKADTAKADTAKGAAPDDGARAKALLEGKLATAAATAATGSASATAATSAISATSASAADARFVVQVGAFADAAKAREARLKLERAGMKTYTHVADTKDGKRIRVRVGPFPTRDEADKAAQKVKGLDLSAAVLTL